MFFTIHCKTEKKTEFPFARFPAKLSATRPSTTSAPPEPPLSSPSARSAFPHSAPPESPPQPSQSPAPAQNAAMGPEDGTMAAKSSPECCYGSRRWDDGSRICSKCCYGSKMWDDGSRCCRICPLRPHSNPPEPTRTANLSPRQHQRLPQNAAMGPEDGTMAAKSAQNAAMGPKSGTLAAGVAANAPFSQSTHNSLYIIILPQKVEKNRGGGKLW